MTQEPSPAIQESTGDPVIAEPLLIEPLNTDPPSEPSADAQPSDLESPVFEQPPARGETATAFIASRIVPKYTGWDGIGWSTWTPRDTADMVRAIAHDYLLDHGNGHDWQEAGNQAQFLMSGIFNDIVHFRSPNKPQGREFDFRMAIAWPGREEGFETVMMRPTEHLIPVLPLPGGGTFRFTATSAASHAGVRCQAPFDCLKIPDEGILQLLDALVMMLGAKDRMSLMLAAAMLARWKGCQVSQVVQGGAVYRQIRNPSLPDQPESDVRILYARTGPHIQRAFQSQGPYSNVVVLA